MEHPQFAYTGRSPEKGYVGFVNLQETDGGVRFSVRSEGENPVSAAHIIPKDEAVALLEGALKGLKAETDEAQIKHMVDRFLSWRLPENFSPDAGISFKAEFNENTPWPMKHEPVGTNLFDATQARAMVLHMLEGLPRQ